MVLVMFPRYSPLNGSYSSNERLIRRAVEIGGMNRIPASSGMERLAHLQLFSCGLLQVWGGLCIRVVIVQSVWPVRRSIAFQLAGLLFSSLGIRCR